jgi:hypothetical protein
VISVASCMGSSEQSWFWAGDWPVDRSAEPRDEKKKKEIYVKMPRERYERRGQPVQGNPISIVPESDTFPPRSTSPRPYSPSPPSHSHAVRGL